ncbi:unnamed protein product [Urochloa decumbens]|uniref:3'-5' exonuclease domain-containing protein n=1 Tax=Urochloa decumbens TaxID=240449 RepID=A0ABC8Z5T6_9POAL
MAETKVFTVRFGQDEITTTVTSSGRSVDRWIAETLSLHRPGGARRDIIVGLDVEWRPSFSSALNPAATLQLCVDRRCLIFQLLHADYLPAALLGFLGDRAIHFYGVGVEADAARLRTDHGLAVANTVDLRGYAADYMGRPELRQAGLRGVLAAVLGTNLNKPQRVTMSRWDARTLSDEQVSYACVDAFVSSEVARKLQAMQRQEQIVGFVS